MEVTSTSSSTNRLLKGGSTAFSFATNDQSANFELLLDLPATCSVCPVRADEDLNAESNQSVEDSPAVASTDTKPESNESESSSAEKDPEEGREAVSDGSVLAVLQAPLPASNEKLDVKSGNSESSAEKLETKAPAIAKGSEQEASTQSNIQPDAKNASVESVQAPTSADETATDTETPDRESEKSAPATVSELHTSQEQDPSKNAQNLEVKNAQAVQPALQSQSNKSEKAATDLEENEELQASTKASSEEKQTKPIEPSQRSSAEDRPARWYERDTSDEIVSKEHVQESKIANKLDTVEKQTSQAMTPLATATADSGPTIDTLDAGLSPSQSSDVVFGLVPTAESTSIASKSASGLAATTQGTTVIDSVEGLSNSNSPSDVYSTEQKIANKATSAAGNILEGSPNGTQVDLSQAERVRLAQRIARSFARVGPTGGSVQLKLHPPELGSLAVNIKIEGRSMSAKLTTESQAAREVIMESLPQLRTRLAEQGYDVVQFTVDVASDSAMADNQTSMNQSGAGQGGQSGNGSESSSRSMPGTDLRRSNYLRRQLDDASHVNQPILTSYNSRSIDVQA